MINNLIRGLLYVIVFVLLQVLFLNNIHFLRIATPFLYLYVILRLPLGESRSGILLFSFFLGLLVDLFGNTAGMHAFATTFAGFCREPLLFTLCLKRHIDPSYDGFWDRVVDIV